MKPYNPDSKCLKCGHNQVNSFYIASSKTPRSLLFKGPLKEHIRRNCCRCAFEWYEKPLNIKQTSIHEPCKEEE